MLTPPNYWAHSWTWTNLLWLQVADDGVDINEELINEGHDLANLITKLQNVSTSSLTAPKIKLECLWVFSGLLP
jgi:hypothetical protein